MLATFLYGFMAGLAATPHCLGMCGGFPLHLAKTGGCGIVVLRQMLFVFGKAFTYMFLGTLAASFGAILFKNTSLSSMASGMRLFAGIITVIFGILMLGVKLPNLKVLPGISNTGLVKSIFTGILSSPGLPGAFLLGLGVGFLPCPLPITMLGIAALSHHLPSGIVLMAGVGLGTAPGLLMVGLFGAGLNRSYARIGMRAAGVVVVALGLLTIGRATGIIHANSSVNKVIPPCCGENGK